MYNIIGEYMSIIELGNGSVLKDGVVFDTEAKKYCTEINKDENGKVTPLLYPSFTQEKLENIQSVEVDKIKVKGKEELITIYKPI